MTIDDGICENCLSKNNCDVLPYSNNCNEVRAMLKHDKEVYNKAIDDFAEKLKRENKETIPTHSGYCRMSFDEVVDEIAEQLKAGGENESK